MRSAVLVDARGCVFMEGVLDTTGENASTVLVPAIAAVATTAAAAARELRRFMEGIVSFVVLLC